MLRPSEHVLRECHAIISGLESGELDAQMASSRLIELDPGFGEAYFYSGARLQENGDLESAESLFWKGLDLRPAGPLFYLAIAGVRREYDLNDPLGGALMRLALRKLALGETISPFISGLFSKLQKMDTEVDLSDPDTYLALSTYAEQEAAKATEPPAVTERVLPYRLLASFEEQAPDFVTDGLVDDLIRESPRVAPLMMASVREWAIHPGALGEKALCLFVAMLGEIGDANLIEDLFDLGCKTDWEFFLHLHWAIWRMGQRFPSEALKAFQKSAGDSGASWRCAMAEHMGMLPDIPELAPALLAMVDDFPPRGDPQEIAYLLAVVVDALSELGMEEDADQVMARCQPLLPHAARKLLKTLITSEEGFLPKLAAEGIDEFDISDVCIGRVMMDEEDDGEDLQDYDEDLEEDEEEEAETRTAPVKPGRNEPCWCGSGKKYKKCHLESDEAATRVPGPVLVGNKDTESARTLSDRLTKKMLDSILDRSHSEFQAAQQLYFGDGAPPPSNATAVGMFTEWYAYVYRSRSTGRTAVEEYLQRHGARLSARERAQLESWRRVRYGLFEVQRVERGTGVELKDLLAGDTLFVHDISCSMTMAPWDCPIAGIYEFEGKWYIAGNGFMAPRRLVPELRRIIEEKSQLTGQTAAEFVQGNSHIVHRVINDFNTHRLADLQLQNTDGDPLEFSSATYQVSDDSAVLEALRAVDGFKESTKPDAPAGNYRFDWLAAPEGDGSRHVYGHLELGPGKLRLECNSRRRLRSGRELVEDAAGSHVRHTGDVFESAEALKRKAVQLTPPRSPRTDIPEDLQREVVMKVKDQHYSNWLDARIPALKGKTPRQAIDTREGKLEVQDLLRTMEQNERLAIAPGDPMYDFNKIRRKLGLPEE